MKKLLSIGVSLTLLTGIFGCSKEEAVKPAPEVTFAFVKPSCVEICEVSFTTSSKNSTTYSWDFGDGSKSIEENPKHEFKSGGIYIVKLTGIGEGGSKDFIDTVKVATKLEALTAKEYKMTNTEVTPKTGPFYEFFTPNKACDADNRYKFYSDGTYLFTQGDIKCYEEDPDSTTGIWRFSDDKTKLIGQSDGDANEHTSSIVELTETTFIMSQAITFEGIDYTFTHTFSNQ